MVISFLFSVGGLYYTRVGFGLVIWGEMTVGCVFHNILPVFVACLGLGLLSSRGGIGCIYSEPK